MTSDISPEVGAQPGARALASRRNGAKSRGPQTAAGRARSSRNALKHGLRARRQVLLEGEDAAEYRAFQVAAQAELAPTGALRSGATSGGRPWEPGAPERARGAHRHHRLAGAARGAALRGDLGGRRWEPAALEAALLGRFLDADPLHARNPQEALGAGLVRDGNGPRALDTVVRYRGSVFAELLRALAAFRLLQADAREVPGSIAPDAAPAILPPPRATTKRTREAGPEQ